MQEKIDWYQEVVDLEPSSKLFFPLAKMLAEQDVPRAVQTLQRGLERHPEFIEARFYFVELLHKHKDQADYATRLQEQFTILSPMLSRYAGFWQAWGDNLFDGAQAKDKALAASFLGAMCAQDNLSMADIFVAGLRSLSGQSVEPSAVQSPETQPTESVVTTKESVVTAEEKEAPAEVSAPVVVSGTINPTVKVSTKPRIVISTANVKPKPPVATQEISEPESSEEAEDHNEVFSLRTRSMADVLAEQGDYAAALEIYEELVQSAQSADEKQELEAKIVSLQALGDSPLEEPQDAQAKASPGNERVISVLGALVDRLDARLHS